MSYHCFKAGENLYQAGDHGDSVHIICSGSVTVTRTLKGRELPYRLVTPGDYVGEWDALADSVRRATACATAETSTVKIPGADFRWLQQRYPELRQIVHSKILAHHVVKTKATQREDEVLSYLMGQGVGEATNVLLIDESICIRCDNCEKACADTHEGTSRLDRKSGPVFDLIRVPSSCRHCEHPHCMKDCPPDSIRRTIEGEVFINDTCIGCGNCVTNCPYDVIQMATVDNNPKRPSLWQWLVFGQGTEPGTKGKESDQTASKLAVKCDMCKDLANGPACVRSCPTGAAIRVTPEEFLDYAVWRNSTAIQ